MRKSFLFAPLAALAFLACEQQAAEQAATEEAAVDPAAEVDAIHALADSYEQAFNAGDKAAVLALYTPGATEIMADGTTATAAENVEATMGDSATGATISIEPERTEVSEAGDMGYDMGTYTITAPGPDGQTVSQTMRYLVTVKKVDGAWKLDAVMGSAPIEAAETAAPAGE
jgi:uncharacterized protein (TIGR02246 family)